MKTLGKIGLFYVIAFVFTIILAIIQQGLGIDTQTISLPQFGPGFAAIVMLMMFRNDHVKLTITLKGIHARKYLGALSIPLVIAAFLFYNQFIGPLSVPPINTSFLVIMLGGILLGAFGEEIGWRGYAQNLLERQLNGLVAFLFVGVLWGFWHVGNFQYGLTYMLFFVFSTIGISAVMAWLLQGSNFNVVLASLFHFGVNVGFYLLTDALTDLRLVALIGIVWMGAAVVIVALNRKDFLQFGKKIQGEAIGKASKRRRTWQANE
jgi:membrane protease YdiL (CAAX protease family)